MKRTYISGRQIRDGSVQRVDMDVVTTDQAVITKVVAGTNISISSTGVDTGTGDVTVNVNGLADVATSGDFQDLINTPSLLENALVTRERPTGDIDGTNAVFTLANTPIEGTEEVYLNGILQESGAGNDYVISGATITFSQAPSVGWKLSANYATGDYIIAPAPAPETLVELQDVNVTTPLDGDALVYDGAADAWKNKKPDHSPSFTYTNGLVTRIDYVGGNYKTLSYNQGNLSQVIYYEQNKTTTKTFTYNEDGTLASVSQTVNYN
jgi:hypothetical protein